MLAALALGALPGVAHATPPDAELVTVTDTGFAATWTTAEPSDTTVCVGEVGQAQRCQRQEEATRHHYAEVTGLRPDTRYAYSLRGGGSVQPPSATNPGTFTTLARPPGRHLFDFAVLSDVHIGEECSGTAVTLPAAGSVPPCFKTEPGQPGHPYAETMARAAVAELNARGVDLVVLNADNTGHADYEQVVALRDVLGGLSMPWHVARGAHDRANQTPSETRCGPDKDCFRHLLFPARPPGRIFYGFDHRDHRFVVLDSAKPSDGTGEINAEQIEFIRTDLARAARAGRKAFVFLHHPVTEYANTTSVPPVIFGVRPDQGREAFLEELGRHPHVVGVVTSHTHRNYVSYSPRTSLDTLFVENGPTKEYPGGYAIFRVYTGGYTRNFHRLRCEFCRQWTSTTRDEYFGLYPLYTLGTLSARNFTHVYGCPVPTPPPSPPFGNESALGGDTARVACPSSAGTAPPAPGGGGGGAGGRRGAGPGRRDAPGGDRPGRGARTSSPRAEAAGGDLPFTGRAIGAVALTGLALLGGGLVLRRRARGTR